MGNPKPITLKDYIYNLGYVYSKRTNDKTFLIGNIELTPSIENQDDASKIYLYDLIMEFLIKDHPGIDDNWTVSICKDTEIKKWYFCLIRDDDPDELAAIQALNNI